MYCWVVQSRGVTLLRKSYQQGIINFPINELLGCIVEKGLYAEHELTIRYSQLSILMDGDNSLIFEGTNKLYKNFIYSKETRFKDLFNVLAQINIKCKDSK